MRRDWALLAMGRNKYKKSSQITIKQNFSVYTTAKHEADLLDHSNCSAFFHSISAFFNQQCYTEALCISLKFFIGVWPCAWAVKLQANFGRKYNITYINKWRTWILEFLLESWKILVKWQDNRALVMYHILVYEYENLSR